MAGSDSAFFQDLNIVGGGLQNMGIATSSRLLSATMERTVDQVSEISFEMHDPNWAYLKSFGDKGPLEKEATYADLALTVSAYSAIPGTNGDGGCVIRLRPRGVEKCRKIRGPLVRQNLSPSQFVADSAINCGMQWKVQDSPQRPSISRDVSAEDSSSEEDKNEWTTLNRLAAEEGFLVFESANTLYFGSPQWLYDNMPNHQLGFGPDTSVKDPADLLLESPTIDVSLSANTTNAISLRIPLTRVGTINPGHTITVEGLPGAMNKKKLLVTSISYPIAGVGDLSIDARDPWKIEKQETPEQQAARNAAANTGGGGGGAGNGATGPGPDLRTVTTGGSGGLTPAATALRKDIMARFGVTDIGGYRPEDGYGEHSTGRALDVMIGNDQAKGTAIKDYCVQNAVNFGLKWCIWQQALWYPDGRRQGMENRGSATQNHFDHVHVFISL